MKERGGCDRCEDAGRVSEVSDSIDPVNEGLRIECSASSSGRSLLSTSSVI